MPLLKKLCENITNVIKERVKDIDDEKAEIINYGLYLWIADIIKLAIIFTAACLLRVFNLPLSLLFASDCLESSQEAPMPKLFGLPSYKQRHNLWFSLFIPAAVFYKTNFSVHACYAVLRCSTIPLRTGRP